MPGLVKSAGAGPFLQAWVRPRIRRQPDDKTATRGMMHPRSTGAAETPSCTSQRNWVDLSEALDALGRAQIEATCLGEGLARSQAIDLSDGQTQIKRCTLRYSETAEAMEILLYVSDRIDIADSGEGVHGSWHPTAHERAVEDIGKSHRGTPAERLVP